MINKPIQIVITFILCALFYSCKSEYYVGETTKPTKVYSVIDTTTSLACTVPKGTLVLSKVKSKGYYYIICEGFKGYTFNPNYNNYHKYNPSIDGILYGHLLNKKKNTQRIKNKSVNNSTSSGGTVNVRGYYRKDGTYVRPHTRKSSGSRKRK